MRPARPSNWEDLIAGYCAATGRSPSEAAAILEACDWNLRTALEVSSGGAPAGKLSESLIVDFDNLNSVQTVTQAYPAYSGATAIPMQQPYVANTYPANSPPDYIQGSYPQPNYPQQPYYQQQTYMDQQRRRDQEELACCGLLSLLLCCCILD